MLRPDEFIVLPRGTTVTHSVLLDALASRARADMLAEQMRFQIELLTGIQKANLGRCPAIDPTGLDDCELQRLKEMGHRIAPPRATCRGCGAPHVAHEAACSYCRRPR